MSKSLGLVIAIVILEIWVFLSAIVPCQLQQTFAISNGVDTIRRRSGNALAAWISEEIEVEVGTLVFAGAHQRHSENFLIELQRLFVVLDANHGVVLHGCQQV